MDLDNNSDSENQENPIVNNNKTLGKNVISINSLTFAANSFDYNKYKKYKELVANAIKNKKIFTIAENFPVLKMELKRREWVEKILPNRFMNFQLMSQHSLISKAENGNDYETAAISRMLKQYPPYFIWDNKPTKYTNKYDYPYRNRVERTEFINFTSKNGLSKCIENIHWYCIENVAEINCPRSYRLSDIDDKDAFNDNYRITSCHSFLVFILSNDDPFNLFSCHGTVPITSIEFALDRITELIQTKLNTDLDTDIPEIVHTKKWDKFKNHFNEIIKNDEKFLCSHTFIAERFINASRNTIDEFHNFWPECKSDGHRNLWIVKPGNLNQGQGVKLMDDNKKILEYTENHMAEKYIVQKYIERPLLIYKTKFDIRQHFLITIDTSAVSVWMYKNCYLRFSSQEFNLNNLNRSIHLTNFSIQKYLNNKQQNKLLPDEHMWSLSQFKEYLKSINRDEIWDKQIYPGMRKNIIGAVMCSIDETEIIKNSFEIYGCDFMLNENFEPILIEINEGPNLGPSSSVTKIICAEVVQDLVKGKNI